MRTSVKMCGVKLGSPKGQMFKKYKWYTSGIRQTWQQTYRANHQFFACGCLDIASTFWSIANPLIHETSILVSVKTLSSALFAWADGALAMIESSALRRHLGAKKLLRNSQVECSFTISCHRLQIGARFRSPLGLWNVKFNGQTSNVRGVLFWLVMWLCLCALWHPPHPGLRPPCRRRPAHLRPRPATKKSPCAWSRETMPPSMRRMLWVQETQGI